MSEPTHSPEPWSFYKETKTGESGIKDGKGDLISYCAGYTTADNHGPDDEDCQRIVACVNFCQEFPTEFLEDKILCNIPANSTDGNGMALGDIPGFMGLAAIRRKEPK